MRAVVILLLFVLVAVGGVFAWKAQQKHTLYVMVPQGIFLPFNKVKDQFRREHPEVEFKLAIDTPEAMAQMVEENKSKPDIFISPGGHELEVLREKGYIDASTERAFGSYELAILVPKDNPGKVKTLRDLANPEVKLITISDPDLNAACYAARMSFQNIGLWGKIEKKMKVTGCCASSFKWIVDGKAEANIQFLGCPMDEKAAMTEQSKVSIVTTFPRDSYYVPRNVAGILKTSKERPLAEAFLKFLTSDSTIKMMLKNRLRNDQKLPDTAGPWGPEQEANPKAKKAA
jgi:molybdate transport system substrate-binding protein